MNAPVPPPFPAQPPFADATDEALSALLDGEFASFAIERGLTEPEARARLEAWPEFAVRRDALALARATLAAPAPPLDELARRQLVRDAIAAAHTEPADTDRRTPAWAWLAGVAAAVLLVVGVGALVSSRGTGNQSAKSNTAGGTAEHAASGARGDLGDLSDVSDPAVLRALLDRAPTAPAPTSPGSSADRAKQSERIARSGGSPTSNTTADCAPQLFGDRRVIFRASGTYHGDPVFVLGVEEHGRTVVLVVRANDCATVLTSLSR